MPRVAIVILNWNCADDTIQCAHSLISQSSVVPDIIIVDNNSSDNSVPKIQNYVDKRRDTVSIHFIKNSTNSGFAGGNNIGILYALDHDYEYIGSLNPDAVCHKEWVSSLLTAFNNDNTVAITTGLIANFDKKYIDTTGEVYSTWGIPSPAMRNKHIKLAPTNTHYIFAATGGGFLARSSALMRVGLFDERFFMYYEDVDLSYRAQLMGYKVLYTPNAVAYHKRGTSSKTVPGLTVYNTFKNLPMLFIKNTPIQLWSTILPRFSLAYTLILLSAIRKGSGIYALKGLGMSLVYLPYSLGKRRIIQRKRTVSPDYISSIILHDIPEDQKGLRKFRKVFTGTP